MSSEPTKRRDDLAQAIGRVVECARTTERSIQGCDEEETYGRDGQQTQFVDRLEDVIREAEALADCPDVTDAEMEIPILIARVQAINFASCHEQRLAREKRDGQPLCMPAPSWLLAADTPA